MAPFHNANHLVERVVIGALQYVLCQISVWMAITGQCILGGVSYSPLWEHEVMPRPAGVPNRMLGSMKGGAAFLIASPPLPRQPSLSTANLRMRRLSAQLATDVAPTLTFEPVLQVLYLAPP